MTTLDQEVAFTTAWWQRTTADESKLIQWLKKLHTTEISGYTDYQEFIKRFDVDDRTFRIFTNIGQDELKHGGLIEGVLSDRGFGLDPAAPKSSYWEEMNTNIIDLPTAAAVNYFGEALAAFRFEVIIDLPNTPADVREILRVILPDEQFHRQTLRHLAGDDLLEELREKHDLAVKRLKGTA